MSWRKILAWEIAPDVIPFTDFTNDVQPGDIWKFRNKDANFEFYAWIMKLEGADESYFSYVGVTDKSLDKVLQHTRGRYASLTKDGVEVLEYVDNREVPIDAFASLRWEVSREGLDEAPRKGARVKLSEGLDYGERSYSGFVVQPGDEGTIVNPHPDPNYPALVEVLWDGQPSSGYNFVTGRSGWYVDLTNIEYI